MTIAVSSCLLGNPVRYDATDKQHDLIRQYICTRLICIPLCPEMAIGLGAPRPTIELQRRQNQIIAWQDATQSNLAPELRQYADRVRREHRLSGYIFKARSPSCALHSAPLQEAHIHDASIHTANRHHSTHKVSGVYTEQLTQQLPEQFPVCEESDITDHTSADRFIEQVLQFANDNRR